MKRVTLRWWTVLSTLIMGMITTGCGFHTATPRTKMMMDNLRQAKPSSPKRPQAGGTVSLDVVADKVNLDPASAFDPVSQELVRQLYDTLVRYDAHSGRVLPMAAKSWSVSKDGRTYTFHLRTGMRFWNGDLVTATSFVNELKRVLNRRLRPHPCPAPSFFFDIQGAVEYYDGKSKSIPGAQAVNRDTLVFHLIKPQAEFLKILSLTFLSAVDVSRKPQHGRGMGALMGSGPFQPATVHRKEWVFSRNPRYWRVNEGGTKLPYLNRVILHPVRAPEVAAVDFQEGLIAWVEPSLIGDGASATRAWNQMKVNVRQHKKVFTQPGATMWYLGMNVKHKPFTDVNVRKAIAYAVNRAQFVHGMRDLGAARGLLPPGTPDQVSGTSALYPYNLRKAKQLMQQSGHHQPVRLTLWSLSDSGQDAMVKEMAQILNQAGFRVQQHRVPFNKFVDGLNSGQADLFYFGWHEDYPDANNFLSLFHSGNPPILNPTRYQSQSIDRWLDRAESTRNERDRGLLLGKVSSELLRNAVCIPIGYPLERYAVQPWVRGLSFPMDGFPDWASVWVG
ncbi:MAG: peptide ABC transporter substrate-binding protein [Alicyclobacillus herbarius]|uniref:ABC transporter substrate-binding protein n=1 Tax=Alicyclobacillus herbarius TaxID=122960 RepID=UPI002354AFEC|nr:peptide ABC transporter substrate-binding protein [Alicyclobacillus herbarius]MCL6631584.1 peptide ABC transporter substrate-binding protein [Alicyclobacillus herbarius]